MMNNYYIQKDEDSKEVVFIEFDKLDGYSVLPKTGKKNEIEVNKIVFIKPSFSEKIIKKKIDLKIEYLMKMLEDIDSGDDEGTEHTIRESLVDAERLKLSIINSYIKFLGSEYRGLTLKKLEIIIKKLRMKLYLMKEKKNIIDYEFDRHFMNYEPVVEEKRGRRGR